MLRKINLVLSAGDTLQHEVIAAASRLCLAEELCWVSALQTGSPGLAEKPQRKQDEDPRSGKSPVSSCSFPSPVQF